MTRWSLRRPSRNRDRHWHRRKSAARRRAVQHRALTDGGKSGASAATRLKQRRALQDQAKQVGASGEDFHANRGGIERIVSKLSVAFVDDNRGAEPLLELSDERLAAFFATPANEGQRNSRGSFSKRDRSNQCLSTLNRGRVLYLNLGLLKTGFSNSEWVSGVGFRERAAQLGR